MTVIPAICVLTGHLLASNRLSRAAKYSVCALISAAVAANAAGYGFLLCKKDFRRNWSRLWTNRKSRPL